MVNKRISGWTEWRTDRLVEVGTNRGTDGRTSGRKEEPVYGEEIGSLDGWTNGQTDGRTNGQEVRWMDGRADE